MFKSKYSNFLTIVLIIAIIAIIIITAVLLVNVYKKYKNNKEADEAISKFQNNIGMNTETNTNTNTNSTGEGLIEQNITTNNSATNTSSGTRKVTYYNNFVMLGYIEIPSINIRYPILEKETVASLEKSVAIRYPDNAKLNEIGNVVIAGHNYRNGMFFSNLKKVPTGDKVKITDLNGKTLVYTVYEKYETTPEDVEYMTRDVGENTEITLVTCTDNSKARIIVKAKI